MSNRVLIPLLVFIGWLAIVGNICVTLRDQQTSDIIAEGWKDK